MELDHFIETKPLSYIVGLLQADGHQSTQTRNRGKISLELKRGDKDILEHLQRLIPVASSIRNRTRDTNFKKGYQSAVWSLCDLDARLALTELGMPCGAKSEALDLPSFDYSPQDYFRGLVDGDGSLGYTKEGFPFLSFVTKSDAIAQAYTNFLHNVTSKQKSARPNTRDQVYNLCVYKEDAQDVARTLYENAEIRLERKHRLYLEVMKWVRPPHMKKVTWERRKWTSEEDVYIKAHSVGESAVALNRTERSIRVRKSRLKS